MKTNKEKQFLDTIDDGIKTLMNFEKDDMVAHFIYCYSDGFYYTEDLEKVILSKMQKYGLTSLIFTGLKMLRRNLITKEKSKAAYQGRLKNENDWYKQETSINDDLESFFNHLQEISSLKEIKKEDVLSFFLPKLTDEELDLIEEKNPEHMMTYFWQFDADVNEVEMIKSNSNDKYLHGSCFRWTRVLNLDVISSETSSETSSESSSSITSESSNEISDGTYVKLKIADELKKLANMGFQNEKLNIHLIQKHCQVNLQAVIEELQAYQTSSGSCSTITVESLKTPAEK